MRTQATAARGKTREMVVFVLARRNTGVDILKVQEIRGYGR